MAAMQKGSAQTSPCLQCLDFGLLLLHAFLLFTCSSCPLVQRIGAFMGQIFTAWSIVFWAHCISSYPSCSAANLFWVLSFSYAIWIWAMLDPNLLCLKDVSRKGHLLGSIPYSRVGGSSSSPIYSTVSWFLLYLSLCLSEV